MTDRYPIITLYTGAEPCRICSARSVIALYTSQIMAERGRGYHYCAKCIDRAMVRAEIATSKSEP